MEQHKTNHFFISITKLVLRTLIGISWKRGAQLGLMAAFLVGRYTFAKRVPLLTHPISWNSHQWHAWPSTQHTIHLERVRGGSRDDQNMQQQLQETQLQCLDLGIPLTGRKGVKGTDRSLIFNTWTGVISNDTGYQT